MHSDSYFCIGASHHVCQDYALSGVTEDGRAYAIVSDGCSGSPDTDFGARFMAKATQWALNQSKERNPFVKAAALGQQMASSCNMPYECLDATVIAAVEGELEGKRGVHVEMAGDGVLVGRRRGASYFDTYALDFPLGYPAYASYMIDLPRMLQYVEHTQGGAASIRIEYGEFGTLLRSSHQFYSTEGDWFRPYHMFFDSKKYDLVMLLSDGVLSFQGIEASETSKRATPVALDAILNELTQFKNMKGEFVVRRVRKFLTKTCQEKGWVHYDDLSVAAIAMDDA